MRGSVAAAAVGETSPVWEEVPAASARCTRCPRSRHGSAEAEAEQLREKQCNPTLDFDLWPEEMPSVLPAVLRGASDAETDKALDRLKERYKLLLKKPLDSWNTHLAGASIELELSALSETAMLVQDVRSEVLGVVFDSKGVHLRTCETDATTGAAGSCVGTQIGRPTIQRLYSFDVEALIKHAARIGG